VGFIDHMTSRRWRWRWTHMTNEKRLVTINNYIRKHTPMSP